MSSRHLDGEFSGWKIFWMVICPDGEGSGGEMSLWRVFRKGDCLDEELTG